MANPPPKRKVKGGRMTPKGGPQAAERHSNRPPASSRYTPPVPQYKKVSPPWVPVLMFALLGIGLAVIFLNYLGVLPGDTKNSYLLVGLGFILGGIVTATKYH
ncbi:MAG TPA: cell division protein CrgA [Acidimicrobiales bacterium]